MQVSTCEDGAKIQTAPSLVAVRGWQVLSDAFRSWQSPRVAIIVSLLRCLWHDGALALSRKDLRGLTRCGGDILHAERQCYGLEEYLEI